MTGSLTRYLRNEGSTFVVGPRTNLDNLASRLSDELGLDPVAARNLSRDLYAKGSVAEDEFNAMAHNAETAQIIEFLIQSGEAELAFGEDDFYLVLSSK